MLHLTILNRLTDWLILTVCQPVRVILYLEVMELHTLNFILVFTQRFHHEDDVSQGQFLSGVQLYTEYFLVVGYTWCGSKSYNWST